MKRSRSVSWPGPDGPLVPESPECLQQRLDQIRCLYLIAEALRWENDLAVVAREVAYLLPHGFRSIPPVSVRVAIADQVFSPDEGLVSPWVLEQEILLGEQRVGLIEVFRDPDLAPGEEPFVPEEKHLLWAISRELADALRRRETEIRLDSVERELGSLFTDSLEPLVLIDQDLKIQRANPRFAVLTGFPGISLAETGISRFLSDPDSPSSLLPERELAALFEQPHPVAQVWRFRDGRACPVRLTPLHLLRPEGMPARLLLLVQTAGPAGS